MKNVYFTLFFCLLAITAFAQYQMGLVPRVSPDKGVYQKIGYTDINIKYGSPSVNGRTVFGDMVPYDKVWRAGANNATTIEFSHDVEINSQTLPKSKYAFFVLPTENDEWTIIFSKKHKQWGAFRYDEKDDALRVNISPTYNEFVEQLSYSINHIDYNLGFISLEWANTKLVFEVKTNYLEVLKEKVETKVAAAPDNIKWVVYIQGAEYLYEENANLDFALEWIEKAEELYPKSGDWNKQYYPKHFIKGDMFWVKARILAAQNNLAEAIRYANKMKQITEDYNFYEKNNVRLKIDKTIAEWESN